MPYMERDLSGHSVAILATHGFEESELFEPLEALREAGAEVKIISLADSSEKIRGWASGNWSESIEVDARHFYRAAPESISIRPRTGEAGR